MRSVRLHAADIHKGSLILVNDSRPLRSEPQRDSLIAVGQGGFTALLDRQAANMLRAVLMRINVGDGIVPVSGFRTMREQRSLYEGSLRDNGDEFTRKYVALPGCSEHQTGLAVDLAENGRDIDVICPRFPYSGVCAAFRESAAEYGFIERYPYGRERITHIAHEPWHFRYVGYPHSKIMSGLGITLEEYTEYLKRFRYGTKRLSVSYGSRTFEIFFSPADDNAEIELPDGVPCQLSGNNEDGVVATLWGGRDEKRFKPYGQGLG